MTSHFCAGGGSGIGRAVCHRFAAEGASVAVIDINSKHGDETMEALGSLHENKHFGYKADVSDSAAVKDVFHQINVCIFQCLYFFK